MSTKKQIKIDINPLIVTEVILFSASFVIFCVSKYLFNFVISDESLVDIVVVAGLLSLLFHRNKHPRFFWYGFFSLVISALLNTFGALEATSLLSSIGLGFFALALVNFFLFDRNESGQV